MFAVKQWARDIIIILLVAHALELTIPFGRSRRYVRLGVGLVILLALLQPVLFLLRTDFDTVLGQAVETSAVAMQFESRLGAVQAAQTATALSLGHSLTEVAVQEVAAAHRIRISRVEVTPSGRVVIAAAAAASESVPDRDLMDDGMPGGSAAAFVAAVAQALGVEKTEIEVRWYKNEEG